jgi:hypothetical protein
MSFYLNKSYSQQEQEEADDALLSAYMHNYDKVNGLGVFQSQSQDTSRRLTTSLSTLSISQQYSPENSQQTSSYATCCTSFAQSQAQEVSTTDASTQATQLL